MIVLAILGTLAAIVWTIIVVWANGMSDAPMMGFQGGLTLWLAWIAVAALWLAWLTK
jgi:hypothetical protein